MNFLSDFWCFLLLQKTNQSGWHSSTQILGPKPKGPLQLAKTALQHFSAHFLSSNSQNTDHYHPETRSHRTRNYPNRKTTSSSLILPSHQTVKIHPFMFPGRRGRPELCVFLPDIDISLLEGRSLCSFDVFSFSVAQELQIRFFKGCSRRNLNLQHWKFLMGVCWSNKIKAETAYHTGWCSCLDLSSCYRKPHFLSLYLDSRVGCL